MLISVSVAIEAQCRLRDISIVIKVIFCPPLSSSSLSFFQCREHVFNPGIYNQGYIYQGSIFVFLKITIQNLKNHLDNRRGASFFFMAAHENHFLSRPKKKTCPRKFFCHTLIPNGYHKNTHWVS